MKNVLLIVLFLTLFTVIAFVNFQKSFADRDLHSDHAFASLTDISNVPAVQVLMPGFSVKEIPLTLTNINVVRYGSDGRLYALAYDGRIYVLTDTDNDGIEDKAEYWWDKDPLVSPVGMVISKEGIYVTCKNKVSLIKDVNKDGKAETEEIITSDWVKPFLYTGTTATGIDAFGIARDKAGNIFFALGAADFTKAYIVDSLGKSHYDVNSQRGTVLRISKGSKQREIFCTGTRFPVAMAFNEEGDLFATDQEGATWLPNGNPYDELLHIQQGRHYGFPPRHPEYLSGVIDEPSVYDYKPQHQSTCGLNFNLPVNDGPVFGPPWWTGDAIVSGYSRGKIYRTTLVKTPSGYVGRNSIFASLTALTVDACISPKGELVIATHSGLPDWGIGPQAEGKLYKVIYTNPGVPNPIATWVSRPDQVKIAFDKPVPEEYLADLSDKIKIEFGEYVEAADRFEVLRPGYRAVERQLTFLRQPFKVKNADLSADRRTLILNTFTHSSPVTYALTLPSFREDEKDERGLKQSPAVDLSYNLNGVAVSWHAGGGGEELEGAIPHLDLEVSKAFMNLTYEHDELQKMLNKTGKVIFKTRLNLWNMLRPDTQPESTIDYKLPAENVIILFRSSAPLEIICPSASVSKSEKKRKYYETKVTFQQVEKRAYALEVSMNTGSGASALQVHYFTAEDSRPRALQTHRFFLPWLQDIYSNEISPVKVIPELAGGNWSRGKELFFGQAMCSNCHSIGGKGKFIGPDLSNLIFRDYKSLLRDIKDPGASINPDYLAHSVALKDDRTLTGMISYKKDSMVIRDIADNKTVVHLQDVRGTVPLSGSLMPPGLDKILGDQKMTDLMAYLLTNVKPADLRFPFLPPVRRASEVETVLRNSNSETSPEKTTGLLRVLWVSSPKDPKIDPNNPWQQDKHDYPFQQERWTQLLSLADDVKVTNISQWPSRDQFDHADVIVFYWDYPEFSEENGKQLDAFLQRGGGLVYLNQSIKAASNPQALANRIGMAWKAENSKRREGPVELTIKTSHPITRGFGKTRFQEESYWQLVTGTKEVNVLATSDEEGSARPLIWTTTEGKGRVFVSTLGHWTWTFDDPLFRILLLRGIAWAGNQPANRIENIVMMGARVSK